MAWGIADTASQIEKIRAESSDYLGGLDSVGEIDYATYCKLWDYYHDLLWKAYEQGLKDAEPVRHGRWVNHISENGVTDGTYCSICDYEVDRDARYNYCPNCGAKMSKLSNWYEKRIKEIGYNGCRNCKHQIGPLRGCEWLERGGDGVIHLICPKWEKKEDA